MREFLSHLPRSASHFCNGPRIPSGQRPAKMVFSRVLPSCGASIEVNIPLRCGIFWTFTLMRGKLCRRMELEGRVLTMLLKRSSFPPFMLRNIWMPRDRLWPMRLPIRVRVNASWLPNRVKTFPKNLRPAGFWIVFFLLPSVGLWSLLKETPISISFAQLV